MKYSKTEETLNPHQYHITTIQCPKTMGGCGETEKISVMGTDLFRYNQGASMQQAFPYLSPAQRERLISGFCDTCFQRLFAEVV